MQHGVTFEAAGRSWQLRYDVNALCAIEEATGESINKAAERLAVDDDMRLADLRLFFWAGLVHENLTRQQAGNLMSEVTIKVAGEIVGKAFKIAFPEVEDNDDAAGAGKKAEATAV